MQTNILFNQNIRLIFRFQGDSSQWEEAARDKGRAEDQTHPGPLPLGKTQGGALSELTSQN